MYSDTYQKAGAFFREAYLTTTDVKILTDAYLGKHEADPRYDISNTHVVEDGIYFNNLQVLLSQMNLADNQSIKLVLKVRHLDRTERGLDTAGLHFTSVYIRKIEGVINIFSYDAAFGIFLEEKDGFDYMIEALYKATSHMAEIRNIYISSAMIQADWRNCPVYAYKATMFYIKHGAELFPQVIPRIVPDDKKIRHQDKPYVHHVKADALPEALYKLSNIRILTMFLQRGTKLFRAEINPADYLVDPAGALFQNPSDDVRDYWGRYERPVHGKTYTYNSAPTEKMIKYKDTIAKRAFRR